MLYYCLMKTAAFIGTFDPLHGAHIGQLLRAHQFMPFSMIYILVDKHPFHKPTASSWQHRLQMAQLTLKSFDMPFDYRVIPVVSSLAPDLTEEVDYKITGIDSLIDNLGDSKRHIFAQRWPMIVLSVPRIKESSLTDAIAILPKQIQQTIRYSYVSETIVPMMNYDFDKQIFISERVHSSQLRSGKNTALIPPSVQRYIQEHQLYR